MTMKDLVQEINGLHQRISFSDLWYCITLLLSKRSSCAKTQQASLIVHDNRIISIGYNGPPSKSINCSEHENPETVCGKDALGSCLNGIHAEQNAIAFAAKYGVKLSDCEIYITQSPCINCAKLISASGIKKVFYINEYRLTEGIDFLNKHNVEVKKIDVIIK